MSHHNSESDKDKQKQGCFVLSALVSLIFVGVVNLFWPWAIPFRFLEFITLNNFWQGVIACWPAYVWAIGGTLFFTSQKLIRDIRNDGESFLAGGFLVSVWAGVVEEICFRWFIFFGAIVGVKITNFIFFGFLGFGIPEFLHMYIFGPIANFTTFGALQDFLFHKHGWAIGAALIATNARFRDGHMYQGLLGFINSWFLGMIFFYVMFVYGLPAAIAVHFLYDMLIFATIYLMAKR